MSGRRFGGFIFDTNLLHSAHMDVPMDKRKTRRVFILEFAAMRHLKWLARALAPPPAAAAANGRFSDAHVLATTKDAEVTDERAQLEAGLWRGGGFADANNGFNGVSDPGINIPFSSADSLTLLQELCRNHLKEAPDQRVRFQYHHREYASVDEFYRERAKTRPLVFTHYTTTPYKIRGLAEAEKTLQIERAARSENEADHTMLQGRYDDGISLEATKKLAAIRGAEGKSRERWRPEQLAVCACV